MTIMANTGKQLESLVREIEKYLLPDTFEVSSNERIFNDEGVQIAEFDIQIKGRVGSSTFNWLIECRDRPASGAAPGSWIEQLVGRRDRFNFDKVTAVSTTGFAEGVIEYAKSKAIDLRSVNEISVDTVSEWFLPTFLMLHRRAGNLIHAELRIPEELDKQTADKLLKIIKSATGEDKILKSTKDGKLYSLVDGWQGVFNQLSSSFDGMKPNDKPKQVTINAEYPNPNNRFQIVFEGAFYDITRILYVAELSITDSQVPISSVREYTSLTSNESISESVSFNFDIEKIDLNIDFHNIKEKSQTFITLRSKVKKTTQTHSPDGEICVGL